jgi:tetratricopeptide (TPR) repeat protein
MALLAAASVYAFVAGLRTVDEKDLGWHMATGRYVLEHHAIPTTDVLSYTSPGAPWIYPPFAGVLFYGIHHLAGYAGLSWFCALAMLATTACLLQRPSHRECVGTAILTILAVPLLAIRMVPRPDLFTHLFFAIFLVLLWRFHRDNPRGDAASPGYPRLWLLPVVMLCWVNLHPGFVAGLAVLCGYLLLEGIDLLSTSTRAAARERLRHAWAPLAVTVFATLLNPFGLRIYQAAFSLSGARTADQGAASLSIAELLPVPISWSSALLALDWRNPDNDGSLWLLAAAAAAAIAVALWRRRFGPAIFLALALYAGFHRRRYEALFVIVVVIVGGTIFATLSAQEPGEASEPGVKSQDRRRVPVRWLTAGVAAAALVLACVHSVDSMTNRTYILNCSDERFGAGESALFPERAADFIAREHLPGNIFEPYNLGGFLAFRLGPGYGDFIDGRGVSPAVAREYSEILASPADSPQWQAEADRRGINVLLFALGRSPGPVSEYCQGRLFRPVYMDELSLVLLRDTPQNRPWLDRLRIDCGAQQFAPPAKASRTALSAFLADTGFVELTLGRAGEAREALERSASLTPEDPSVHLALAQVDESQQEPELAEEELKTATALRRDSEATWLQLAGFYLQHQRFAEARQPLESAAELAEFPAAALTQLGRVDLALHEPERARSDFDRAARAARSQRALESASPALLAQIAAGRAMACAAGRDWKQAIEYQQEATRETPGDPGQWQSLADISAAAGDTQLAQQARQRASALLNSNQAN